VPIEREELNYKIREIKSKGMRKKEKEKEKKEYVCDI
jgi:hypothetical protein